MLVPAIWSVLQLALLGSLSRSVRLSTSLLGIATGMYGCGLLAVLLELVWTSLYAGLSGRSRSDAVELASYTVDPVIEEVVKVLPLLLAWLVVRRVARGLGLVDHLLIGAACGSGFGLLEATMRYGSLRMMTMSMPDSGYIVSASLGGSVTVPDIGASLVTWLPTPTINAGLLGDPMPGTSHLVWSALAGVGVGWLCTHRGASRLVGLLPLAYVCFDHCRYNYLAITGGLDDGGGSLLDWLHGRLGLAVFLALVAATVLDRIRLTRARSKHPELLLAGETPGGILNPPLFALAGVAMPWTTALAARFARARRSVLYACQAAPSQPVALGEEVLRIREQLSAVRDRTAWRRAAARMRGWSSLRATLRGRTLVLLGVWLVLCAAPFAYYVIGGFPSTRGIQKALGGRVGTLVFTALAAAGVAWLLWRMIRTVPALRRVVRRGGGEVAVRSGLRLWTGVGAVVAGGFVIVQALQGTSGLSAVHSNYHVLDALSSLLLIAGLAVIVGGFIFFPPLGLAVTAEGVVAVSAVAISGELVATTAGGLALSSLGIMLNEATGDSSGGEGGDSSGGARQQRLDELSRDPAHGGKITPGSREEAEAALGLEEQGALRGPVRRATNAGEDFVDGAGRPWDVKAFRSQVPGRRGAFNLTDAVAKIRQELRLGENVILDTRKMTGADADALKQAVQELAGSTGRVLFWP